MYDWKRAWTLAKRTIENLLKNPIWKLTIQLASIFSIVIALSAMGVALCASQVALEVEERQLEKMRERHFLALAFCWNSESGELNEYDFSLFPPGYPSGLCFQTGDTFLALAVINSGSQSCKEGKVFLAVPEFLDIEFVDSMGAKEIRRPDLDMRFWGTPVYELSFANMLPWKGFIAPGDTEELVRVGFVKPIVLKTQDSNLAKSFEVDGKIAWPLIYQITTEDDNAVYPQRWIWIYWGFGKDLKDTLIMDSLFRANWEANFYDEEYRPERRWFLQDIPKGYPILN